MDWFFYMSGCLMVLSPMVLTRCDILDCVPLWVWITMSISGGALCAIVMTGPGK